MDVKKGKIFKLERMSDKDVTLRQALSRIMPNDHVIVYNRESEDAQSDYLIKMDNDSDVKGFCDKVMAMKHYHTAMLIEGVNGVVVEWHNDVSDQLGHWYMEYEVDPVYNTDGTMTI